MAQIVLGVAAVHTPLVILPPEDWVEFAERDYQSKELVFPPDGLGRSYADAHANHVSDEIKSKPLTLDVFRAQYAASQAALDNLKKSMEEAKPDVVIIVSDDQDEWFYDDNMPALSIYWGDSVPMIPRPDPVGGTERERELQKKVNDGYMGRHADIPVEGALGRYLIERLMEDDFDIGQMTYVSEQYQGSVRRRYPASGGGEIDAVRTLGPRPVGLPHGYSFIVQRLMPDMSVPIVPILQNTCYPPNAVGPRRCFAFGQALKRAIDGWDATTRVAVVASGGMSHFVVDEEFDRSVLDALMADDAKRLRELPRERLYSATSETLNWVTLGGMVTGGGFEPEVIAYEAIYRTPAGTGAGVGFMRWLPVG